MGTRQCLSLKNPLAPKRAKGVIKYYCTMESA